MKKVSIILPCYNGEKTLQRALGGVLKQTYRPIQLILVNDGSTDKTHQIATNMIPVLTASDIEFVYIQQDNKGLGGAINTGLKIFDGDYLAWIDADDELLPDSVKTRVEFLEQNPEYSSVSSNAYLVKGDDWNTVCGLVTNDVVNNSLPNQFENLLFGKSIICSGCHLVRTEAFLKVNPQKDIYEARHGQNFQMLLPIYYASKHAFIDKPLYKYAIAQDQNMTAQIDRMSLKELYKRRNEYIAIVANTIDRIFDMPQKEKYQYKKKYVEYIVEKNVYDAIEKNNFIIYLQSILRLIANRTFKIAYVLYPVRRLLSNIKTKVVHR